MPITDRSKAKEGGFAQVRVALTKFKGTVIGADFDKWGGQLVDEQGKKKQPREFLEISCIDVEVLEVTEELTMDISEEFNFRENCSDFKGSFWIEIFLASADAHKILIPDGLVSKRVTFEKATLEAVDKDGNRNPKYDSTNYVIVAVEDVKPKTQTAIIPTEQPQSGAAVDPLAVIQELAIGKTEAELKDAISKSVLAGTSVAPVAEAGILTQALVKEGKLVLVDGKYQKPR